MQSHELLRDVLQHANVKQVASDLGLSLSMVYKWAEPPPPDAGSGAVNPLDRVATLLRSTSDRRLAHWVCEQAGGFFIQNPKAQWPHALHLIPATNHIVQEFADLLSVVAVAASDDSISRHEAKSIRARWEELKSATEGFVRCCEEGNFALIKEAIVASERRSAKAISLEGGMHGSAEA